MSRLVVPVSGQILWRTGDVKLRADLFLLLKDHAGNWRKQKFLLDTGTELTTFPAAEAKWLGLPMPPKPASGAIHAQTGLEIRSGILRFRVEGVDQTEYGVACLFLGDPDASPAPNTAAALPRRLLQPLALVKNLRFTLDRDLVSGTPYGEIVVEKK